MGHEYEREIYQREVEKKLIRFGDNKLIQRAFRLPTEGTFQRFSTEAHNVANNSENSYEDVLSAMFEIYATALEDQAARDRIPFSKNLEVL